VTDGGSGAVRRSKFNFGKIAVRTPMVTAGQRIGLMGGTFNPPHAGHLQVAETAIRRLGLDQLWWLVTPGNPLKSNGSLPPLAKRMDAARRMADNPRIKVTGFEAALGSAYTVDTISFLCRRHPGVHFVWVMGADGLQSFHRWRHWVRIAESVPIAVIDRPGHTLQSLSSPAARALAKAFVPSARAMRLAGLAPPAWTFLSSRLSPLSSTALRSQRRG